MKARLGILVVLLCLFSGCVAIPPLVTVQHRGGSNDSNDSDLKARVTELEQRVRDLESKTERP